jgi:hypothetical protein
LAGVAVAQAVLVAAYLIPDEGVAVVILTNLEKVQTQIVDLARWNADLATARTVVQR